MNLHNVFTLQGKLTKEKADQIIALIHQIQSELPFLRAQTRGELRGLAKVGDAALSASASICEVSQKHPESFPAVASAPEIQENLETAQQLARVLEAVRGFEQAVSHTALIARSNAYRLALKLYKAAQVAASLTPGLYALIAPLRALLDRPSRKKKAE